MSTAMQSILGLEGIGDLASLLDTPKDIPSADAVIEVDITLIDEDPNQPRTEKNPGFSKNSIDELSRSILSSGQLVPISVKKHPTQTGRYMINDGARRYRATLRSGLKTIKVILNDKFSRFDQMTVNLQREDNTPEEYAHGISVGLEEGLTKSQIAEKLGKTPGWVTVFASLLNLPKALEDAYKQGRITDVNIVYELSKLFKAHKKEVVDWLNTEGQEFTRGQLKLFREYLADKKAKQEEEDSLIHLVIPPDAESSLDAKSSANESEFDGNTAYLNSSVVSVTANEINAKEELGSSDNQLASEPKSHQPVHSASTARIGDSTDKFKKTIVIVEHDGRPARILLDKRPSASGLAWVKYEDDGHVIESPLSDVKLVELIEG